MAKIERYDLIDHFTKSSGYDIALMTTFNFEIPFFERALVNRLYARNVKKVALFVDAEELDKSIQDIRTCYLGRRYSVSPIRIKGVFHPKVILLLGKKKAKLIVGSANIKTTGYMLNNEVFNYFEYSDKEPENIGLIREAIDFFVKLSEMSNALDKQLFDEVKTLPYYLDKPRGNGEAHLIHNLNESILNQVTRIIGEKIETIDIAVPYFDSTLKVLEELKRLYPKAKISLYLQNGTSTFPEKHLSAKEYIINTFRNFKDDPSNNRSNFYHGKVILFKSKSASYILYGSANCTRAALTKTPSKGGNIECNILEVGNTDDFNYFFKNIKIEKNAVVEVATNTFSVMDAKGCFFKYGESDEKMTIHLAINDAVNPVIRIGDVVLDYVIENEEIVIEIPDEIKHTISEVFELIVSINGEEEAIKCWTNNKEALYSNRLRVLSSGDLSGFNVDPGSDMDKFNRDRTNLLNAILATISEVEEYKRILAQLNRDKTKPDDEDDDPDYYGKDYVVNIEAIDSYHSRYRQVNQAKAIQELFLKGVHLVNKRLIYIPEIDSRNEEQPKGNTNEEPMEEMPERDSGLRSPSTSEQRFARFVKNRVKGLLVDEYVKAVNTRDYYGVVRVIIDIFEKYKDVDVFDDDFVLQTRTNLYVCLLSKEFDEKDVVLKEQVLYDCCELILDLFYWSQLKSSMEDREYYDDQVKILLLSLKKDHNIRTEYKSVFKKACEVREHELTEEAFKYLFLYIEDRFGYKDEPLLEEYIKTMYENASVEVTGSVLNIRANDKEMKKHLIPNIAVLTEISKFARQSKKISRIIINVLSSETSRGRSISRIEHSISLMNHNRKTNIYYSDGSELRGKPEFISL